MKLFDLKQKPTFNDKDILMQLDKCADEFTFPMLDNGYVYPIDSRLTAYCDKARWVLIIEVVGFNYRGGGHDGINNCLHIFGNCLDFQPGTNNDNFIYITDNSSEGATFDEEYLEALNPGIKTMLIREKEVQVSHSIEFYKSKGVDLEEYPKIYIWEFLRGIVPDYRDDFFASESEIRDRIPKDIPRILQIDEWYHIDLADGEKPSQNETFIMIAKILETGDTSYYKPTKKPNNHWKNWPTGGTL